MEPYRIKSVESLRASTREERHHALTEAGWNLFGVPAELCAIDLLTDSGTGAMSDVQWAALMRGDEAYAGSRSFAELEDAAQRVFGFPHIVPTHQCRAAEHILFELLVRPGDVVPNNVHFDTTRANVESVGGVAADCVAEEAWKPELDLPFKGNVDLALLERALDTGRAPLAMVTITCNSVGGHPVSLENLRVVSALCRARRVPLILDACRFAENAWLVHERGDPRPVRAIVHAMFALADGCTFSAKKDGLCNIGGLFACRDRALAERFRERLILTEGFPTYGGLAGRDLAAMAIGLQEVLDERYLAHRIGQVRRLHERLEHAGIPLVRPSGGHAVFVDARRFLPHIQPELFPGQALACALFIQAGVRACEIGTLMFGKGGQPPRLDLVRLAIPRRTYTDAHLDFVADNLIELFARRDGIRGLRLVRAPQALRHFTAQLEPV